MDKLLSPFSNTKNITSKHNFMKLHIDIETYSSIDIMTAGAYKYTQSIDFEILMIAYAYDNGPVKIIDLAQGEKIPDSFLKDLFDPLIEKHAHNANFERQSFKAAGYEVPIEQWHCSQIKSAYCGLPLSLDQVSKALRLEELGKSATGKALIKYFACPVKPTATNGMRLRNLPHHDLEKWEEFKDYCMQDVEAERAISNILSDYKIPKLERQAYILDQRINDKGILIDLEMADSAVYVDNIFKTDILEQLQEATNLENPNSPKQLTEWLESILGYEVESLAKDNIKNLLNEIKDPKAINVLELRQKGSKTSVKKYTAMKKCACDDQRAHGLFQFYGANRTGRWAGRLVQLQNLPRNYISDLNTARQLVKEKKYDVLELLFDNIADLLSQLIRTAFIAPENKTLAVADFSAIEARVLAWLANEKWRIDVFSTHGKIYEASASMMFGVPLELIKKGNPEYELRQKGKVAELALGYGGAVGAMKNMGGVEMGLSDLDMKVIVSKWRKANPAIVAFWADVEKAAIRAVVTKSKTYSKFSNLSFEYSEYKGANNKIESVLLLNLPSGRSLFYQRPKIKPNRWGQPGLHYENMDQTTKKWCLTDTYGGKLTENIVQAVARDLLLEAMLKIDKEGFDIVMHVHDEIVNEVEENTAEEKLKKLCDVMGSEIDWAKGLPLGADGYITKFYKKD